MAPLESAPRSSPPDIVRRLIARAAPLAIAALAGCDAASAPSARPPVSLSFAARHLEPATTATSAPRTTLDLQTSDENNTLTITSVELVFGEVELERAGVGDTCAGGDDSSDGSDDDYSSGSSGDDDCMAAHPDFQGINLRLRGSFDGAAFQYTASLDNEIEMDFRPALEVGEAGVNITVSLDVLSWFRGADGALIDPRTAVPGQTNASVVSANIWRSLAVFEDDDHDGDDDHGGHGGDGSDD